MVQRADTLLDWLTPYLNRVSPRTRKAVTQAILKSANGEASRTLIEQLTPERFIQDLKLKHFGLLVDMHGVGPRELRELRGVMGIVTTHGDDAP